MTIKEALEYMENEIRCIQRSKWCDRDCAKCELVKEDEPLIEAYGIVIDTLEKQMPKKPIHIHEEYPKHQWQRDEDGEIDTLAWDHNYCNGPVCERCGDIVCVHCNPDYDDEECIVDEYCCPNCGRKLYKYQHKAYCDDCGQALDWEE